MCVAVVDQYVAYGRCKCVEGVSVWRVSVYGVCHCAAYVSLLPVSLRGECQYVTCGLCQCIAQMTSLVY